MISAGRVDGLYAAVVRLGGGVVRVGAFVVGTGNVVPSWTDWNVCSLMLSSVVGAGNFVKIEC